MKLRDWVSVLIAFVSVGLGYWMTYQLSYRKGWLDGEARCVRAWDRDRAEHGIKRGE